MSKNFTDIFLFINEGRPDTFSYDKIIKIVKTFIRFDETMEGFFNAKLIHGFGHEFFMVPWEELQKDI